MGLRTISCQTFHIIQPILWHATQLCQQFLVIFGGSREEWFNWNYVVQSFNRLHQVKFDDHLMECATEELAFAEDKLLSCVDSVLPRMPLSDSSVIQAPSHCTKSLYWQVRVLDLFSFDVDLLNGWIMKARMRLWSERKGGARVRDDGLKEDDWPRKDFNLKFYSFPIYQPTNNSSQP